MQSFKTVDNDYGYVVCALNMALGLEWFLEHSLIPNLIKEWGMTIYSRNSQIYLCIWNSPSHGNQFHSLVVPVSVRYPQPDDVDKPTLL